MILIVEDDPHIARLISVYLGRRGFSCEIVSDGRVALARVSESTPAIIFADLKIQGMPGDELCSVLKANEATRSIPFVILSGDRDIAERARACGADDHMGKPFEFDELISVVEKYARAQSPQAD